LLATVFFRLAEEVFLNAALLLLKVQVYALK